MYRKLRNIKGVRSNNIDPPLLSDTNHTHESVGVAISAIVVNNENVMISTESLLSKMLKVICLHSEIIAIISALCY